MGSEKVAPFSVPVGQRQDGGGGWSRPALGRMENGENFNEIRFHPVDQNIVGVDNQLPRTGQATGATPLRIIY